LELLNYFKDIIFCYSLVSLIASYPSSTVELYKERLTSQSANKPNNRTTGSSCTQIEK